MKIIFNHKGESQVQPEKNEDLTIIPGFNAHIEVASKGDYTLHGNFAVVSINNLNNEVRIFCHQSAYADGGAEITRSAVFYPAYCAEFQQLFRYVAELTFERALSLCAIFEDRFEFKRHLTSDDLRFIDYCPVVDEEEED